MREEVNFLNWISKCSTPQRIIVEGSEGLWLGQDRGSTTESAGSVRSADGWERWWTSV